MPHKPSLSPAHWMWGISVSVAGILAVGAVWAAVAGLLGNAVGWMALVAAADAVFLLRIVSFPGGWPAAFLAGTATLLSAIVANWLMAATLIGRMMGLPVLESAQRLGVEHAFAIARLSNDGWDIALIGVAVLLAAVGGALSGRRRSP